MAKKGRPEIPLDGDWLATRKQVYNNSDTQIAKEIQTNGGKINARTIKRRCDKLGKQSFSFFCNNILLGLHKQKINDVQLKELLEKIKNNPTNKNVGIRHCKAELSSQGYKVSQRRVQYMLKEIDVDGTEKRKSLFKGNRVK